MADDAICGSKALTAPPTSAESPTIAASKLDEARARVAARLVERMREVGYQCDLIQAVCR
jgi:hypothetical protein